MRTWMTCTTSSNVFTYQLDTVVVTRCWKSSRRNTPTLHEISWSCSSRFAQSAWRKENERQLRVLLFDQSWRRITVLVVKLISSTCNQCQVAISNGSWFSKIILQSFACFVLKMFLTFIFEVNHQGKVTDSGFSEILDIGNVRIDTKIKSVACIQPKLRKVIQWTCVTLSSKVNRQSHLIFSTFLIFSTSKMLESTPRSTSYHV